ncbi:MAG: pyridoxamine 5'-phosphate oxidase family protein [Spirochaetota bacterium]
MRRKEREITDTAEIESILKSAEVATLALIDGDTPYALPLNFGYRERTLFIHCALEGRKIDMLRRHPSVAFSVFDNYAVIRGETACHWGVRYRSVLGTGRVRFITDAAEKKRALDILMSKFTEGPFVYDEKQMSRTCTFAVDIATMSGKQKL